MPRSRQFLVVVCGLALVAQIAVYLYWMPNLIPPGFDAWSYLAAARAIARGQTPYQYGLTALVPEGVTIARSYLKGNSYINPPIVGIALLPIQHLELSRAIMIWLAVVALATVVLAYVLQLQVGARVAWLAVFTLLPTWESWYNGQVNVFVALCYAVAIHAVATSRLRAATVSLTLGFLIKITPLVGLLVLFWHRPRRTIPISIGTCVLLIGLSLLFVPIGDWMQGVLISYQVGRRAITTLSWGPILRSLPGLLGTIAPIAVTAILTVLTLWRTSQVGLTSTLAASTAIPLITAPIMWGHHFMMLLPALAVLWNRKGVHRYVAVATWLVMNLAPAYAAMLILLPLCWLFLCWPTLLGSESLRSKLPFYQSAT